MAIPNAPERVSGQVEAVNPKGCRINGQWWNWSKWAEALVPPERGQLVILILDKSGFVRSVAPLDGSDTPTPQSAAPGAASAQQSPSTKDRTITRLAVLKAAAEYAASKEQSTSGDVLKIAEAWEQWVLRPYDGAELEEAF